MKQTGEPDFKFYVFDQVGSAPFNMRSSSISKTLPRFVVRHPQKVCSTWLDVLEYEEKALEAGYEGLILRSPHGAYKQGRSTLKEGICIKLKRFLDSEAEVIAITELQHNLNAREVNEVGRTKRSTHQAGKSGGDTMGSLYVRDLTSGVEFEIGTGFTAEDRQEWWNYRIQRLGLIVKYKFFPVGVKDKPRHPVYLGVRDPEDM
jgi:DNA ligase-1